MVQPAAAPCPKCDAESHGAKFCPNCGAPIDRPAPAGTVCPGCGTDAKDAKFCPNCEKKLG